VLDGGAVNGVLCTTWQCGLGMGGMCRKRQSVRREVECRGPGGWSSGAMIDHVWTLESVLLLLLLRRRRRRTTLVWC
jgi:hypothetical protein